jgi:hypothetical protein
MTAAIRHLTIEQGTDWNEDFQILDSEGVVESLAGCSIAGVARSGELRTSPIAFSFTFVINTGENRIYVTIPRATTSAITTLGPTKTDPNSTFYYDYELTRANGLVERIQQGRINMDREITRP